MQTSLAQRPAQQANEHARQRRDGLMKTGCSGAEIRANEGSFQQCSDLSMCHTYIHTYIHTNIHTYIHTCIPAYTHAYMNTDIHTWDPRIYVYAYKNTLQKTLKAGQARDVTF